MAELMFILLSLACHGPLSPFLPAAYEPILLSYGQLYPPLAVALVGALTSTGAEYLNYCLYRRMLSCRSLDRLLASSAARSVERLFSRQPFLATWICAWSPLPDWSVRILASHSGYSLRRYLVAFLVGRVPKFWFLAAVGALWMPGPRIVMAIVAVSLLVPLVGVVRRRLRRLPAPAGSSLAEAATLTPGLTWVRGASSGSTIVPEFGSTLPANSICPDVAHRDLSRWVGASGHSESSRLGSEMASTIRPTS